MSGELDRLLGLLASADREDRLEAACLLGPLGDGRAVPALLQALAAAERDEDSRLLSQLCEALGVLGDAAALEPLARLAATPMMAAVRALGYLRDGRAAEVLVPLLGSPRYALTAGTALGRLGDPGLEWGTVARCQRFKGVVQPDGGGEPLGFDGTGWDDGEPPQLGMRVSFFRLADGRCGRVRAARGVSPEPSDDAAGGRGDDRNG